MGTSTTSLHNIVDLEKLSFSCAPDGAGVRISGLWISKSDALPTKPPRLSNSAQMHRRPRLGDNFCRATRLFRIVTVV